MLHRFVKNFGCCALLALVMACGGGSGATSDPGDGGGGDGGGDGGDGGGGGGGPPPSPFFAPTEEQALYFRNVMPDELSLVQSTYSQGGRTPFADLPIGTIAYSGFMEVLFTSTPNANIASPATLTVDMGTGATTGSAQAFMGYVYNSETDTTELALYDGGITFLGASLTAASNGNAIIDIEIDGAFDNGVQQFTITGNIDGPVYGPDASGIYASGSYFGLGQDITLTADGAPVYGTATLWALSD
ncbi:hypothetical protein SAMN05421665_2418 [Yoonia rosea]|uniref:Transferrin-binding protein B C-lobe/N-lobe beta barrel domain-containing protein n=2 Tax=Yoonia rosea TaxID=287098 RepID=A0A1R3X8Q1_9RHOB|nr:hypothetical protein SAMN05421665_2418 [Yoonia rosea]